MCPDSLANEVRLWKKKLPLAPWAQPVSARLAGVTKRLNRTLEELTTAVEQEAEKRPQGAAADDPSWRGTRHGVGSVAYEVMPVHQTLGCDIGEGSRNHRSYVLFSWEW